MHMCLECKTLFYKPLKELSKDQLQKMFIYNKDTGELRYKIEKASKNIEDLATTETIPTKASKHRGEGPVYLKTTLNGKAVMAHRVIFKYMTGRLPNTQIDHINHNGKDNRWCNLREVNHIDNCKNHSKNKNNTSGVTGVSWHKPTNK